MSRSPRWSPLLALCATAVLVFTACGGAASPSPAASAPASQPAESVAPYDGLVYPEDGSSACGTEGYSGQVGSIKAIDAKTVEFSLCAPDAAFLSKIAFTSLPK